MIRVYLVWGLRLQDRRKCHFTDYKCKGETVFDDDFDMNLPECQILLLVSTVQSIAEIVLRLRHIKWSVIVTSYIGVEDRGLGRLQPPSLENFPKLTHNRAEIGLQLDRVFVNKRLPYAPDSMLNL